MPKQVKRCPQCHHIVHTNMHFCPNCGFHLTSNTNLRHQFHNKKSNHATMHLKHQTKNVHRFVRTQHNDIKQPSFFGRLKINIAEIKKSFYSNTQNKRKHKKYSLQSSLRYTDICIISAIILILLAIFSFDCLSHTSSKSEKTTSYSHTKTLSTNKMTKNNPSSIDNKISEKRAYPIKRIWAALQADLDNRAVKDPYGHYFVGARQNTSYSSLVMWKANIFSSTPAENLSGIRTIPKHFHYYKGHLDYNVKYKFPLNNNYTRIQIYKWHAILQNNHVKSMTSDANPIQNKVINN